MSFASGLVGTRPGFLRVAYNTTISVRASHSKLGNADSTMDVLRTIPISSDSLSSASRAASRSSFATANAMESVRSPPSADSASEAVGELPSIDANDASPIVNDADLKAISSEGYVLRHAEGEGLLHLRRLVLGTEKRQRSSNGIHKKRPSAKESRLAASAGIIFGSTLRSVLDYSGVSPSKGESLQALRHLVRFLTPAAAAVASVSGSDRVHLSHGLGVLRVCSKQSRFLPESGETQGQRSFLGRNGLRDVAFGATAAVLTAHYIMCALGANASTVADNLQRSSKSVDDLLGKWPTSSSAFGDAQIQALRSEARAIRRARAAAVAAASVAESQCLPKAAALHLQFEWMRAAAWPRGTPCNAETHATLCGDLASGKRVGDPEAEPLPLPALPLSALQSCSAAWMSTGACDDSSDAASSRASSWASSAASSCGGVESGAGKEAEDEVTRRLQDL